MELADILVSEAVAATQSVSSKKRLLLEIAEQAEALSGLSKQKVFEALQERELLGATGMGKGIAVPHARMADVDRVIGFFTRLEEGIDFDASDNPPVTFLFSMVVPEDTNDDHLQLLASLAELLDNDQLRKSIQDSSNSKELFKLLTQDPKHLAA